jgi:hypothetical protein
LLFFADAQITTSSTNMVTFIPSIFFKRLERLLMCTLNYIMLKTALCGRPIFHCLYFDSASSHCAF